MAETSNIALQIEPIARYLLGEPNAKLSSDHELRFGQRGSMSVDLAKGTWYDHERCVGGGVFQLIKDRTGVDGEVWINRYGFEVERVRTAPGKRNGKQALGKVIATYPYQDEVGAPLFEVVRFDPKDFRQRRPDPRESSGWNWSVKGVRQVPYRLPRIVEQIALGRTILIVEGEKDADNLWRIGIPATCNAGGAGKWSAQLNGCFRDAHVVVVPDIDPQTRDPKTGELRFHADGRPIMPGQDHAADVARHLAKVAASVRVLDLSKYWPDMPPKADISDWLALGHSREELDALIEQTEEQSPLTVCHTAFKKWFGGGYDLGVINAVLAASASERLPGDPPWLLVISGSGNAKTETVQATSGVGARVVSTISSIGALLSASPRRERGKTSTGGLLREIGERGLLIIKDFTSILSSDRNVRAAILAALREVYDGYWVRDVGTDGGQKLEWRGRVVVIGACTTAWDQAHGVIASMGDRFICIRSDSSKGRLDGGAQAIRNAGKEAEMREALAEAVANVINEVEADRNYVISAGEEDAILRAADVVALARTGVEQDYKGEVIDAHAPEMPTRLAKQLTQIMRGALAIGLRRAEALQLVLRCARDSMPQLRLQVLLDVAKNPDATVIDIRRRLQKPRTTIDRTLQALHILGLLTCRETEAERGGKIVQVRHYTLAGHIDLSVLFHNDPVRKSE